jgi:hypothetical protein
MRPEREGGRVDRPVADAHGGAVGRQASKGGGVREHFGRCNLKSQNSQYSAAPWEFSNRSGAPSERRTKGRGEGAERTH